MGRLLAYTNTKGIHSDDLSVGAESHTTGEFLSQPGLRNRLHRRIRPHRG